MSNPTTPTFAATVAPSGQSIVLLARDGNGAVASITSLRQSSEVQSIRLTGAPSGNAFTLSFGGHQTAPIATVTNPPSISLLWTFPTVVGHSYTLAINFAGDFGTFDDTVTYGYETIVSGVVASLVTRGASPPSTQFSDPGVNTPGGSPLYWEPVNPGIAATAASMQLRFSGSGDYPLLMAALRVEDTTTGTVTYYTASEAANVAVVPADAWFLSPNSNAYGGSQYTAYGNTGIGQVTLIAPAGSTAASVLQSALQALPSIGPGNVTVADLSGTGAGNYQATFAGVLSNESQPLLACSDPLVSIAEVTQGGIVPTLSVNGGAPSPLGDWVWCDATPLPYALCPLPQAPPASQTCLVDALPCNSSGNWDGQINADDQALSNAPVFGWSAGRTLTFAFPLLTPGTYRFAATYPNAPFTVGGTTYQPSTKAQFLVLDNFGNTLATYSVDQSQAPSDYQSAGHGWKVLGSFTTTPITNGLTLVMNTVGQSAAAAGSTQPVAILDAIQFDRTSADNSVLIGPNDVATLNIPAGWATTTAGVVPAINGLVASPPSPNAILPPFVAGPKSMKVGYNVEPTAYYSSIFNFSNLAYLMSPLGSVQDANGYPTRFTSPSYAPGTTSTNVISPDDFPQYGDPPQGTYLVNPGLYLLQWDGSVDCSFYPYLGTTIVEQVQYQALSPTAGNRRVYNIQFDPAQTARPCFQLVLKSTVKDLALDPGGNTYVSDLTNLRIYPPDPTDPTGNTIWGLNPQTGAFTPPPKFHPWFLYKLQGMQCLRFLDPLYTNVNPASLLAHYKPDTHANRTAPTVTNKSSTVASIKQATIAYPANGGPMLQVATSTPHGLFGGCAVNFSGCGTATFADGQQFALDTATTGVTGLVYRVIDDHTVVVAVLSYEGTAMTNVLTGGSLVAPSYGTLWSLQDIIDLVEAVPTVTDIHFNVSASIDVTPGPGGGAYDVAAFLAAKLQAGIKVHCEFGNECWNNLFLTHDWCAFQEASTTGTFGGYETWFADQSKAVHDQFLAAFTAAGRPGDMIHLYGVFTGQPANTAAILSRAKSNGAIVDEVCINTYFGSYPFASYSTAQTPIFNAMNPAQLLDYTELNAVYGQYPANCVGNQFPVLQQYGYGHARVIAYEGGLSGVVPIDVDPNGALDGAITPNFFLRQNAARRHPRMYGVLLQHAQGFQDAGLTMWSYFNVGNSGGSATWDCYEYGNQQRGTGSMQADAINVSNPIQGKNQTLNELGGAWHYWSTLVAAPGKSHVLGRNGKVRAIGLPGGTQRLVGAR